jgi:CHAD domain-containing protein
VEAIHETRKSLKKIRALLTLAQDALGACYKQEAGYFRGAGHLLAAFRDNAVMLQVFDALASRHPDLDAATLGDIRLNLQRRQRETPTEKDVSGEVIRLLQQARSRGAAWPLDGLEFEDLLPAFNASYRRGRKAFKRSQKCESVENLHNFRKEVKQHWYHLRLVESLGDQGLKTRIADLHDLETCLGDEHNLNVLASRLSADAETSRDRRQIQQVLKLLNEESHVLRKRALEASERLYSEKANAFSRNLAVLGSIGRKGPAPASAPLRANSAVA